MGQKYTTVANKTYFVQRMFKQTIRIDGIAFKLSGGTCTIQLSVDGVAVVSLYSLSTTVSQQNLTHVIEIDAKV